MTVTVSKPAFNIREKITELEGKSVIFPKGTINNPYRSASEATANGAATGLYYFSNSIGQVQELFYDSSDSGWILYASNNAADNTLPLGTGRNSLTYTVNRNNTFGPLGTPNPDKDFLIGSFINNFAFSKIRVFGFGYASTNSTYSFFGNIGTYIIAQWDAYALTTVVARANVSISGNSSLASGAAYFAGDLVLMDYLQDSAITANTNQCTIGGGGVTSSAGNPDAGCYLGHGLNEGTISCEGWYNSVNAFYDSQGYTSWIR